MAKLEVIDGVPHRWRRGKLVPIPDNWFGKTVYEQTKRKRRQRRKK